MLVLAGDKAWKVVGPRDLEVVREGVADFARGVKHPHARRLAAFGGFLGAVEILERVRAEDLRARARESGTEGREEGREGGWEEGREGGREGGKGREERVALLRYVSMSARLESRLIAEIPTA